MLKFAVFHLLIGFLIADERLLKISLPSVPTKNFLSITSDSKNFLWIGTDQGLVRYDGIDSDIFRSNPFSSKSLSGNRVWFLDNYNEDTLVVVTDNAIHLYSKKNYEFEQFKISSRPTNYFKNKYDIWITTLSGGVYKLNSKKEVVHFKFEPLNPFSISSSNFESINGNKFALDHNNSMWLATSSGLNKINDDNTVRRYFKSNTNNLLLSENILSVHYDNNGKLLIGTDEGLNYYDIDKKIFNKVKKLEGKPILGIKEHNDKILILTNSKIHSFLDGDLKDVGSNNNFATSIQSDQTSVLWTKGKSEINTNGKRTNFNNGVNDVFVNENNVLLATSNGLFNLTAKKQISKRTSYKISEQDNVSLINFFNDKRHNQIKSYNFDSYAFSDQYFWFVSSNTLTRKNIQTGENENFNHNPRDPNTFPKSITSILIDGPVIWVGSNETGLYSYDIESLNMLEHYQFDINDPNSLQTSLITSLAVIDNKIYIGSGGDGLFTYSKSSKKFEKSDVNSGLSSDIIYKLFVLDDILFVHTSQGLNYLTQKENYFKSIDSDDGLSLNNYNNLKFSNFNNQLIIENDDDQFSVDVNALKKLEMKTMSVVKSVVGIDSKNNEHLLSFINNKVDVPPFITSIAVHVAFPSIYKAKQNLYSYSYGSKDEKEIITKKAGENISISKIGYTDKVLIIKSNASDEIHAKIDFNYIPPWYFTWWAIASYVIITFSGIYLFTTIRAKRLQQRLEESRKSEELEEARNLQLQLLAKKVPEMKNVEVETYIRTATEVGGDYYDFFELDDGTLIAACGDATGHGATSGMMVSITKAGLKGIQKRSPNEMLTDLNNIVKSVEIGRIRMSLNLLEFKNGHVNISSAAMPPVYHYSKRTDSVNEIELVGTPLGSFYDEEFDRYQVDFEDGDALVLMSDGLPEAPNHDGEMLDYPAVKKCIKDNGSKSASGIKDSLVALSDKWLDGIQNPDDITLVIFKKNKTKEMANA